MYDNLHVLRREHVLKGWHTFLNCSCVPTWSSMDTLNIKFIPRQDENVQHKMLGLAIPLNCKLASSLKGEISNKFFQRKCWENLDKGVI